MSEQKSFVDIEQEQWEAEQEAKIKVKGNHIVISLDDGRGNVVIVNLGNRVEVRAHFFWGGAGLVHSSSNVFEIAPVTYDRTNPPEEPAILAIREKYK